MNLVKSRAGLLRRLAEHQAELAQLILDIESWDLLSRSKNEPLLADSLPGLLETELELVRMLRSARQSQRRRRSGQGRRKRSPAEAP